MRPGPPLRTESFRRAKRALDKVAGPLVSCFSPIEYHDTVAAAEEVEGSADVPRSEDAAITTGRGHIRLTFSRGTGSRRASTTTTIAVTAPEAAAAAAAAAAAKITTPTASTAPTGGSAIEPGGATMPSTPTAATLAAAAAAAASPAAVAARKMDDGPSDDRGAPPTAPDADTPPESPSATSPGPRPIRPEPLKRAAAPVAYFPKNGAQTAANLLRTELPERPTEVGPVFDIEHSTMPIPDFDATRHARIYYGPSSETGEALEPPEPSSPSSFLISGGVGAGDGHGGGVDLAAGSIAGDGSTAATVVGSLDGGSSERAPPSPPTRYLVPSLAPNERLRLTLLWYHTEGIEHDVRLLSKIDTLVKGVQKAIGWEYAIAGILSESTYTRLATANLPIALLPRRESTCAHTINQAPRTIFMVTDMSRDWRFRHSPHVEVGGLRSYAGTQLRLMADDGAEISLGSLCVASDFVRPPLSPDQQEFLVRFAELISSSIASHTRQRRLRTRQRMTDLLSSLDDHMSGMASAEQSAIAIDVVSEVYPRGHVSLQVAAEGRIIIEGRAAIDLSDVRDGIWEDTVFIEESIRRANHGRLKSPQAVRAIVARCGESDKYIVVASRDIHHVFDDFDAWFVGRCATAVADSLRNQLLKQALEARETFMRGITHQLRTPIHGILGSVELLEEELTSRHLIGGRGAGTMASTAASTASSTASTAASTANTPSPAWSAATSPWPSPSPGLDDVSTSPFACISAIKNAGLELRTTINNILKHNHWNAGLRQCRPVPYDLRSLEADVLPGVLSILQPDQLSGLSVHFALDFSGGRSVMMTDSLLLRDSLEAILLNAVQAVLGKPDGAVVVKVRLGDIAPAGRRRRLTVDVVDNGCGIDVASHDKIFEPYEKVDSYKPGAGLGLTVAARISAALNGCVRLVSSAPGAGSCFRLEVEDVVAADDMMPPVPGLCVDEDATAGGECERADLADPAAALGDPAAQALFLPRTYTDIRTGPAARHFVDHTIAFLEQHGFRRNDAAADVGLVVTNVGPDRVASVIAPAYPDAVVVWCGEKERHRRGSLAPSPSGLDSMPGCISLIGGPLHTQRLKEMLRMAEDLYRERKAPAAGKRKRKGKKGRRRTGEAGPGASASAAPSAATSAAPSAATSAAPTPMEEVSEAVAGLGIAAEAVVLTLSTETTAATDVSTLTPPPTTSTPPPPPPLRALLVDDNPINLRILQMFCKRRSIPHVTATDGNKAIAAYLESYGPQPAGAGDTVAPITLVFMDLQMPHCDGLQATTTIRAWERDNAGRLPGGAPAKVFMVTGQDAEVERDGAMRAGADEFLVKPVGPAELDRVVEKYFPDFRK